MAVFETSVFQREVDEVIKAGVRTSFFEWKATVHTPDLDFEAFNVDIVVVDRDYIKNVFDVIDVELTVAPGTYENYVIPNKDKIYVTLTKTPKSEVGNVKVENVPEFSYRYRAILYDSKSDILSGANPTASRIDLANRGPMKTVKIQLVDPVVEQLRLKTIGTIFRNTTASNAVRVGLAKLSEGIKNAEDEVSVLGVDVAPNFIDDVKRHIVIPHMTKLVQFPETVHSQYGVYNGGFGYYLQNGIWYLYPPFDITRYPKTKKTLTVLNVPAERYPQPERSYRQTTGQVIILATGEVKHLDVTESLQLNQGNGVRFADANLLFQTHAQTGGNKALVGRGDYTAEFVSETRRDGINNAQQADDPITANYALERSKIAARKGSYIQVVWEASNDGLIYPGMPTKLMYLENTKVQQIFGNVVGSQTFHVIVNQGPKERKFMAKTVITLFIDRTIQFEEPDYV